MYRTWLITQKSCVNMQILQTIYEATPCARLGDKNYHRTLFQLYRTVCDTTYFLGLRNSEQNLKNVNLFGTERVLDTIDHG